MGLKKTPANGMRDILPREMEIRDYLISLIKKTYSEFGFLSIETPCIENIENLTSKQGGENEKLIFKILKRGEKLNLADAKNESDLTDLGLRYDLTVPMVRYYANHENELPTPFKVLQMGNVWRADRPQKGRYRQFMQCDIDIIGEGTNLAEIELILATTTALDRMGFKNFQIRINERRLLKGMAAYCGFTEEEYDGVFINLDKLDKIGIDGVRAELTEEGYDAEKIDRYIALFEGMEKAEDKLQYLKNTISGSMEEDVIPNLQETIRMVDEVKTAKFEMVFDPSIVRGMSYYTGTIFEIAMPELGISCGGGGRYDKMVGRFIDKDLPACGLSIGFERILLILMEQGFEIPGKPEKVAYLLDKGVTGDKLTEVFAKAKAEREDGTNVQILSMMKNKKFQKQQLSAQGYERFEEFYAD
ncbi:MAG: histidine--tRNA ligase [Lachnospiraceae bacterium]|nr:histidine--tRNA ligase [Lachnospiraceae bacterium]